MNENLNELSELDFMSHIICTICDYAKENGYEVAEMLKSTGENIVEISEICDFDDWE